MDINTSQGFDQQQELFEHPHPNCFWHLLYAVLFRPVEAAKRIDVMLATSTSLLFIHSMAVVVLGSLSLASYSGQISSAIPNVLVWFFSVLSLAGLAWLFRSQSDEPFNFARLYYYAAFTQAPLILMSLCRLWENSSFAFPLGSICKLWSWLLWVWAILYSLRIGLLRSVLMVSLAAAGPILIVIVGIVLLIVLLIFSISQGFGMWT